MNQFSTLKPEKIPQQKVTNFSTSPIKCSHCLEIFKSHFSAVSHFEHSQLQLDKFSKYEITLLLSLIRNCFSLALLTKYAPMATKHHDINASRLRRMHPTFGKSISISPAVLKFGYTNLIFTESGAKINRQY